MKAAFLALLSAAAVPALSLRGQTPTPYVETTTLTFYWGLTQNYVTNAETPIPSLPDTATFDPELLPSGYATYTDTLKALAYTGSPGGSFAPAGANQQIIQLLLQRMVRAGLVGKSELDYRWQLVAVREAPKTVSELATNPYRIFLTAQSKNAYSPSPVVRTFDLSEENVDDDPIPPFWLDTDSDSSSINVDTGLTISLGSFSGTYTESKWDTPTNSIATSATGSVATAFSVDLGAIFYDDPLHSVDKPARVPAYNFHLKRNFWRASASGLISYGIRSISGPLPAFAATNVNATAVGWFTHHHTEVKYSNNIPAYDSDAVYYAAGTAPLRITMSTIQYQKRNLFFPAAPSGLSGTFDSVTPAVDLSWTNATFGTSVKVERKQGSGAWGVLATLSSGTTSYSDDTVVYDSSYTYRLQAINRNGASIYSAEVTVATPTPAP